MTSDKLTKNDPVICRFAADHGIGSTDVVALIGMAETAAKMQTKVGRTQVSQRQADQAIKRFEEKAVRLGFGVMWPGLYPMLMKDGKSFMLPD